MNLLFSIKSMDSVAGGAERVLCILASELAHRGHDVGILTFDAPGGKMFYDLSPQVERIDLGVGNSARPARLVETLGRIAALRRAAVKRGPDVAIAFTPSAYVPMAFALAGTGIPVVGSEHNVPERYEGRTLQRQSMAAAAPLMRRMTVLSETIRERYPAALRKKMVAMTNPVPPVPPAEAAVPLPRQDVILNVGRLTEQKDQETLLRAFALLAGKFPEWQLRILGEGPLRPRLEALAAELGVADRVQMPGATRDIHDEYRRAGLFALSSRYESFGLVIVEAMQHGLPSVAFADCPGANEFLTHGENALLAGNAPSRAESLAGHLETLIADPGLRGALGQRGRQSISGRFDPVTVCDQWENLLQTVADTAA